MTESKLIFTAVLAFTNFAWAETTIPLSTYLAEPVASMDAQITVDSAHVKNTLVKSAVGGVITWTSPNGDIYTLTIPAKTLLKDTTIGIAAIQSFKQPKLSFTSEPIGVQLTPEGLDFLKPVLLSIQPAKKMDSKELVPVTANETGKELRLTALSLQPPKLPGSIDLVLHHFSPYVIFGSQTARETIFKAFNKLKEDRITSWVANQIAQSKATGLPLDRDVIDTALTQLLDEVIKPSLNQMQSCAGGMAALGAYNHWRKQVQLTGAFVDSPDNAMYKTWMNKAETLCKQREIELCYNEHRPFEALQLALMMTKSNMLMGNDDDPISKEMMDIAFKCNHFQFVMDSTFKFDTQGNISIAAHADVAIWLNETYGDSSKGTIRISKVDFQMPQMTCTLTSLIAPPEDMEILKFIKNEGTKENPSIAIEFVEPRPDSTATFNCSVQGVNIPMVIPPKKPTPDYSQWGGSFVATHMDLVPKEFDQKSGLFKISNWKMLYGEIFAEKTYDQTVNKLVEKTKMTIYHRPLPLK